MEHDRVLKAILQKLADHYSYVKHLGGGEFSNVYLVNHIPSGKERALKILDYHYLLQRLKKQNLSDIKDPFNEIKRRFIAEAKLYKKIDNPNIVKIHDTGVLADPVERIEIPYFIMTYIKGASLADLIKANAPFEVNEAIKISRCVLEALEIMHQSNIIHRDIKASNIMIEGETGEAVIIDFGIAKDIVGGTKLTTTGALLGSPAYMAPEQFIDSSKVGPAMDIYAYGVVLFEMLTGDTPFKGSNFIEVMNAHRKQPVPMVSEKNPALPEGADHILAKAMAKDPKDRYKNAGDFLDSVQQIYQAKRPIKWKRILLTLAASVVVAVVGLLIFRPSPVADPVQVKIDDRRDTPNLKPKGTPAIEPREASKQIPEVITPEQLEKMKTDFLSLKALLEEKTADSEKLRRARQFMETYQAMPGNNETAVMITGIDQTVKQLQAALEEEKKFRDTIAAVNRYIKADDFKGAENSLKNAQTLSAADPEEINRLSQTIETKKQEDEKQNGTAEFQRIEDTPTLAVFLDFKAKYPRSRYLEDLKDRIKKAEPNLPPEKYWGTAIFKNRKGYYESSFGDVHNLHRMVYLPARNLWIDKYEVSNGQFRRYLKSRGRAWPNDEKSRFLNDGNEYPVVVRIGDAEKYCKAYGLRLPSQNEWEYAAGKGAFNYPWGNDEPNTGGKWRANFDSLGDSGEQDGFEGTAPVVSFEVFSSPFDLVNMSGNVWEWVQGGLLKGGSFLSDETDLTVTNRRGGRDKDKEGFRCIKEEKVEKVESKENQ